jgi:DNA-binding NarL/FixJ family response regulator
LAIPPVSGSEALAELSVWPPAVLPVVISASIEWTGIVKALHPGAADVALKTAAPELLFESIGRVVA